MSDEPQRPTSQDDRTGWKAYWGAQGMPWRTEPEITEERQRYLAGRRGETPDFDQGIYPFAQERLTRADIEWLLATHQSGGTTGPVSIDDGDQREGLDLRGADLRGQDLSGLPLACMRGGVTGREWLNAALYQREAAAVHMEDTTLRGTHLEGAGLREAHLERAYMRGVHLEGSELVQAHLEGAILQEAWLTGRYLAAHSDGGRPDQQRKPRPWLPPSDLHLAFFDSATSLSNAKVGDRTLGAVRVADVRWNGVNVARTSWADATVLGDEAVANEEFASDGTTKSAARRLEEHQIAVRAYRQLAIVLRDQGVNEDADRFAYRALQLQRKVLVRQHQHGRAVGSWFLDLIAGYGYKPLRSVWTYVGVLLAFAAAYFAITHFGITPFLPTRSTPLAWYEALILSISSFHGRGLFPTGLSLGDPVAILAAAEAILGLLIEITFIATFTNRFFAR